MALTQENKLRSLAGIVGVGSLALFGVTACDDGGTADEPVDDGAGVEEENGADGGLEEDGEMQDDTMEEDPADEEADAEG